MLYNGKQLQAARLSHGNRQSGGASDYIVHHTMLSLFDMHNSAVDYLLQGSLQDCVYLTL